MLNKQRNRFVWVDILRGLAALGVVLFHVRVDLWVGWNAIQAAPGNYSLFDRLAACLSAPFPFLGYGVMLFFLLSGFCVHLPYAGTGRIDLATYAVRRSLRIVPPYLAAVAFSVLVERIALVLSSQQPSSTVIVVKSCFMIQNYGWEAGQLVSNPSLWSLPVELELYAVYPLFFWLMWRAGCRVALSLVALVSGAALLWLQTQGAVWVMGNFAKYWIIWCAGAWLAERVSAAQLPRWKPWLWGLVGLAFAGCVAARLINVPDSIQHFVWAAAFFPVLWWGLSRPDLPALLKPGLLRAMILLGEISYSLYLIHFPLFKLCGVIWTQLFGGKPSNLLVPLAFALLSLPVAYGFHRLIEVPSHQWARTLARKIARARQEHCPVESPRKVSKSAKNVVL